ncbi:hypothetical protein [Clostridium sp. BJN0013]|uniref:hypothetical protein n=1 Tax=Clostridium sp. BJN0013 TaxID=3236840 RepID=UPI0034C5DF98
MSWENIVILGDDAFLSEKIYVPLEVRTQLAWVMSHYTNTWCEFLLEENYKSKNIDQFEWDLTRIYQQTDKLIDSTIATRYQGIFDKMIQTSLLKQQITKAKESLEYLHKYNVYLKNSAQRKYAFIIELVVFIFAFLQSVPLFFQLPFFQGNKIFYFQVGYSMSFILFIILFYLRTKE